MSKGVYILPGDWFSSLLIGGLLLGVSFMFGALGFLMGIWVFWMTALMTACTGVGMTFYVWRQRRESYSIYDERCSPLLEPNP